MANTINSGNEYRTKISKGLIPAHTMVSIKRVISWDEETAVYVDKNGNEAEYLLEELISFGYIKSTKGIFDIISDHYGDKDKFGNKINNKDKFGNKDVIWGNVHLTKNVRSSYKIFTFWEDCLYSSHIGNGYDYHIRELTDQEVIDILLEEILYGISPDLSSTSLVGTTSKGIDKDPNYHNGNYLLPNNKDYTMTWCRGEIIIREGADGGWYPGKNDIGREIYSGELDWERYKQALIRKNALQILSNEKRILEEFPEVILFISEKIKTDDKFKLNKEFELK